MPIYEYSCAACDSKFELLLQMSNATSTPPCPTCNSSDTRKLLSLFASPGSTRSAGDSGDAPAAPATGGGHCGPGSCGCGKF